MKRSTARVQFMGFLVAATLLAVPALGGQRPPREKANEYRPADISAGKNLDQPITVSMNDRIRVEGKLSCNMGEANTGEPCDLKLQDRRTGHVFSLTNNSAAMRMYHEGTKQVAVQGTYSDTDTIRVESIENKN